MRLKIEGFCFSYGKNPILKDVSFDAVSGEVVSILGSNGAGKTTLLKCIAGILKPYGGSALLDKADLLGMNSRRRARLLSYVPQAASTSRTTVFDSVLLGRRPHLKAAVSDEDMAITGQVIEAMGLSNFAVRYIDQLSGGELQKVQIARAMAQQAPVLILDEPSNNLDIANQHRIMKMIRETALSQNVCVLMTIHDINLALQYSDRFLFIEDDKTVTVHTAQSITPDDIKNIYGIDSDIIQHNGRSFVVPAE